MNGQKIHLSKPNWGLLKGEFKFLGCFLTLISFSNLIFSNNTFALITPTLSASVDNTAVSVNGNQVINSANKTTEIPLNLTVSTNNKTGYTATLNSETNETALVNNGSTTNAKINSISSPSPLGGFLNNTWGYKLGANTSYAPIPALSIPAQILQTAGKTNGNESNQLSIGMKLSDNLESGRYTNKLVFSILTNNYEHIAIMTEGTDFNEKLKSLETSTNKIEHFKKSTVVPVTSMNAANIEDEDSDYEIKLWLDPTDKTAYYYAEPERVYLNEDMNSMFRNMSSLTSLNLSNLDTSKVTNMGGMFLGVSNLATINLSNFDTSKVINMSFMFFGMSKLTTLNLSNFNTSKVIYMNRMFSDVSNLTTINLSNFDTSKVTNMGSMFYNMSKITTFNLSNFNTSQATNMDYMFAGMSNLTNLQLSELFDTSNVRSMRYMFHKDSKLTSLDLSSFNTKNVTNMDSMFSYLSNITDLNLSTFNTQRVTNMNGMFYNLEKVKTLDLSTFDTSRVMNVTEMFALMDYAPDNLEKIYVSDSFSTENLTSSTTVFRNRKKLRGGAGSYLANPSTANKSWLRIDDPVHGRPGYFTRKP